MSRSSKRAAVLDAAFAIVGRDGVRALTYEALTVETGLTKGGLLYHFPSREALLEAMHERVGEQWHTEMSRHAGRGAGAAGEASEGRAAGDSAGTVVGDAPAGTTGAPRAEEARLAAYVRSTAASATRAELRLLLEAADEDGLLLPWRRVLEEWAPAAPDPDDDATVDRFVARLAADGLWLYEALTSEELLPPVRERLVARIIDVAGARDDVPSDRGRSEA
ncbi:TetR family transcriptional regulator [Georgenia sp. Z1491]|uniref:TetR family transcriptional regulator n=1 Tax=Georgenia sp. Z1491 TaxID=3416707 RepID=UPI003CF452D2